MTLSDEIKIAFTNRSRPVVDPDYVAYDESEKHDLECFHEHDWQDLSLQDIEERDGVWFHLSPSGFSYYLPALMLVSFESSRPDLAAVDNVISELDRSPNPDYWSDLFVEKWLSFSVEQYEVIENWLCWLFTNSSAVSVYENTGDRCLDTVELLKSRRISGT